MDFYEALCMALAKQLTECITPDRIALCAKAIQDDAWEALSEIKSVLEKRELDDQSCFSRIEEIVSVFENHSITINGRHDFG